LQLRLLTIKTKLDLSPPCGIVQINSPHGLHSVLFDLMLFVHAC